jgi:manganese transport protein
VFFKQGKVVTEIEQAHEMLAPLLGTTLASGLFAIALLASGQSSTLTGTYAGQIVMEGFLNLRLRPWMRRLITRAMAVIPAVFTVWYYGEQSTLWLLLLSQAIISMQLPFAVIPLIRFTNDGERMGEFANRAWVKLLAWSTAVVILALNFWLLFDQSSAWLRADPWRVAAIAPLGAGVLLLLGWVTFANAKVPRRPAPAPEGVAVDLAAPAYRRILVPLDHTELDRAAITHAAYLARLHSATLHLMHVEEGATSRLFGSMASDAEVHAGEEYFRAIVASLADQGLEADLEIVYGHSPKDEIVKVAQRMKPDLIVMGAHGHRGVKDLMLGNTINGVRHEVDAPVLVVGPEPSQS